MINKNLYTKSNLLSFLRLLLAIPLWFLLDNFESINIRYLAFTICIIASVTDILDGYYARKNNQITELGKIIDPLADKIVIGIIVIKLYAIGEIPLYYFLIIILRDAVIFLGGIIVAQRIGKVLPSNVLGKITVINIGIVILLIILDLDRSYIFFRILFASSLVLIFASLIGYLIRAKEFLERKNYGSV